VSRRPLRAFRAVQQAGAALLRQPLVPLSFSAAAGSLHLLSWALFVAGDAVDSGVLGALLHGTGMVLYVSSLVWLIEGLGQLGLSLSAGQTVRWGELFRWLGPGSGALGFCLLNLLGGLALIIFSGFVAWTLLMTLLPALSVLPVLLTAVAGLALLLSQLLAPCLVLDAGLSPSRAFRRGWLLLERHWWGLLKLLTLLTLTLCGAVLVGLLTEALLPGFGVAGTGLALVVVLPWLATSVAMAYRQLEQERGAERVTERAVERVVERVSERMAQRLNRSDR